MVTPPVAINVEGVRQFEPDLDNLGNGPNTNRRRNPFRFASLINVDLIPRVAKAQPWAGIRERFQR